MNHAAPVDTLDDNLFAYVGVSWGLTLIQYLDQSAGGGENPEAENGNVSELLRIRFHDPRSHHLTAFFLIYFTGNFDHVIAVSGLL